jgi:hypothetical protein
MLTTPGEPPPNIIDWDIVSTFDHSLAHAANRFAHIGNPNEVQLDLIATLLRLLENLQVGPPAQSGFERKRFASRDQFVKLAQKQSSGLECNRFRFERDNPRAISSAFRKRITPMLGRNSFANVVLPAPLQPAMR